MKKWIIIIGSIIVVLIVIGVLHDRGYLNFKWTTLTNIFAALAGPYMLMKNKFFNRNLYQAYRKSWTGLNMVCSKTRNTVKSTTPRLKKKRTKLNSWNNVLNLLIVRFKLLNNRKLTSIKKFKL